MSDTITWLHGVERFDANPTATVALDRARWESLGATFVEVDDGDDETPGFAYGEIDGLGFGVLDYGDTETYLLVAGRDRAALDATRHLLTVLATSSVIDLTSEIVDVVGGREPVDAAALAGRLAAVEQRLDVLATSHTSPLLDIMDVTASIYPSVAPWVTRETLWGKSDRHSHYYQLALNEPGRSISKVLRTQFRLVVGEERVEISSAEATEPLFDPALMAPEREDED